MEQPTGNRKVRASRSIEMPGLDADDDKYGRKTILDRLGIRYVYQAPFIKSDIGSSLSSKFFLNIKFGFQKSVEKKK